MASPPARSKAVGGLSVTLRTEWFDRARKDAVIPWLVLAGALAVALGPTTLAFHLEEPQTARAPTPHPPILVTSNEGFLLPTSGVIAGTGTAADPYVIRDWIIDMNQWPVAAGAVGIFVQNTDAYFLIRDVVIRSEDPLVTGIVFDRVAHGMIESVRTDGNIGRGLFVSASQQIRVGGFSTSENALEAFIVAGSQDVEISDSDFYTESVRDSLVFVDSSTRVHLSNISVELKSQYVQDGTSGYPVGVDVSGGVDVTLDNVSAEGFYSGTYLSFCESCYVRDYVGRFNGLGLAVSESRHVDLSRINATDNDVSATYVYLSSDVRVANSRFQKNPVGLQVRESHNVTVESNLAMENSLVGFWYSSVSATISHSNEASDNEVGWLLDAALDQDVLESNIASNNSGAGMVVSAGTWRARLTNTTAIGNGGFGIAIGNGANHNQIAGGRLGQNKAGGILLEGDNNTISGTLISGNTLLEHTLGGGIVMSGGCGNEAFGNDVADNQGFGIVVVVLPDCQNTVGDNRFARNTLGDVSYQDPDGQPVPAPGQKASGGRLAGLDLLFALVSAVAGGWAWRRGGGGTAPNIRG